MSSSYSRIIPKEKLSGAAVWAVQALNEKPLAPKTAMQAARAAKKDPPKPPEPPKPSAEELAAQFAQQRYETGYREGYDNGYAEAQQALQSQFETHQAQLAAVVEHARAQADHFDDEMAQQVIGLATAIARQVVRNEIAGNPNLLIDVVHEGLEMISESVQRVVLHLHPNDAALVRGDLGRYDERVHVIEDAGIEIGGCRFVSAQGEIDATVTRRLASAMTALGMDPSKTPAVNAALHAPMVNTAYSPAEAPADDQPLS